MLPFSQKILFLVFAAVTGGFGVWGFLRLYRRIARGRTDTDTRTNNLPKRIGYALVTTLTQSRTFRRRPVISFFHSFIFYGFTFYLMVNLVDALDGYVSLSFDALGLAGHLYVLAADILSALVLIGVIALVARRFLLPSRHDFTFNKRTLLHPSVRARYVTVDSIIVSSFILFHVGSRAIGAAAKLLIDGPDRFAPFATLVSHLLSPQNALAWRVFGYWGALGSVLAFLAYFPYSKHVHIFMAPAKYLVARDVGSGVLPMVQLDLEAEEPALGESLLGAAKLEELAWPRLLDAYACIQCNRCQDVCPATATGKALSPSALEINKRMELNQLAKTFPQFESGTASPNTLLKFALSPEATWACTTCGACIDVCPVQDEPMLDIIDVRRQQVMIEGEFPAQLQTAFRGMERSQNPWGINHEKRLDWAEGLNVRTTDQNPEPDVLFWVGCAASYDPQSQKTARAFVQLLDHAGVDYAVLGKRECCTGDTARRAGNEYLYRQLADTNVATLNEVKPKLIVATCPHCMNSVGKEYKQLGADYKVMHHTEYLETLVSAGKLEAAPSASTVTYHDPCYLGRHNGVYDAPRNMLNILSNSVVELPRNKENGFCCGAGGAQFWKEEEDGDQRISDNRFKEVQQRLAGADDKVLAVGCPFCKSMLESTPERAADPIVIQDIAELLLEGVRRKNPDAAIFQTRAAAEPAISKPEVVTTIAAPVADDKSKVSNTQRYAPVEQAVMNSASVATIVDGAPSTAPLVTPTGRKTWAPKQPSASKAQPDSTTPAAPVTAPADEASHAEESLAASQRKAWAPKRGMETSVTQAAIPVLSDHPTAQTSPLPATEVPASTPTGVNRKAWTPKRSPKPEPAPEHAPGPAQAAEALLPDASASMTLDGASAEEPKPTQNAAIPVERKTWVPKKTIKRD